MVLVKKDGVGSITTQPVSSTQLTIPVIAGTQVPQPAPINALAELQKLDPKLYADFGNFGFSEGVLKALLAEENLKRLAQGVGGARPTSIGPGQSTLSAFDQTLTRSDELLAETKRLQQQDAVRREWEKANSEFYKTRDDTTYALERPDKYYEAFGTVPLSFQGLSGYNDPGVTGTDVRYLTPDANAKYVLYSPKSGKVLLTGSGEKGLVDVASMANKLNTNRGRKADWQLYQVGADNNPTLVGGNLYNTDTTAFGKILYAGLPALGALAFPALGIAGGALGAAAGAATGSALSGTLQGQGIGDSLKNAAIAGGATYLGGELFKGIGSLGSKPLEAAGQTAGQAVGQAAGELAGEGITVVGSKLGSQLAPVFGGAVGGLTSSQLSNALSDIAEATKPQIPSVIEAAVQPPAPVTEAPIVVTGQITQRIENAVGSIIAGAGIGELTRLGYSQAEIDTAIKEAQARQDTVTATKPPSAIPIVPDIFSSGPPPTMSNQEIADKISADQNKDGLSTLEKIRLGLLGADLISGLFKPGQDNSTYTDNSGPLKYTPLNRTAITPGFDPFTYGQDRPEAQQGEFLFFQPANSVQTTQPVASTTVPAATKLAKGGKVEDSDMHDDMIKHLMAYRSGGGHMGPGKVKGIGSGQEDLIPAWLSDGEYVWSAQDVADLGDGSTDEGVRRLDKMREMVRKQAGRKNVKKIAKPQKGIDSMLKAVGGRV